MTKKDFDLTGVDTVLFDFDGTLADTNGLIIETWRQTTRTLAGRDISDEEIRASLGEMLVDSFRRIMPDVETDEALRFYREYQQRIFLDRIKLFDGAEDVLRTLRAAGYKTALVTSRLRNSTEKALAHFKIADLFDAVLTASDTDKFKPDPTPVYMILDMVGSLTKEAILIGDTKHDVEAGQAAGVFTVLADWSFALPPEKRAGAPAPDAVIKEMRDILKMLNIYIP